MVSLTPENCGAGNVHSWSRTETKLHTGGGLRKNGGLLIEWPSDWAVGIDDGWKARGQLYQVLIWDESDEGGDDWVGTHMYVGAVVTRRTWDWTDTEEYGEMRTEDSDWGDCE